MSSSSKAQAQQQQQQQQQQRRQFASSPPSPIRLNRALSAFYSAPSFDERKKSTSLLPSPTTMQTMNLEIKKLPDEPSSARNSLSISNPVSPVSRPTVALTMATPIQPYSSTSPFIDQGDSHLDQDEQNHQPFRVNMNDIPTKQSSPVNSLSEVQQRGMDKIKRLSTEVLTISREGSPVPRVRKSGEFSNRESDYQNTITELSTLNSQLKISLNDSAQQRLNVEEERSRLSQTVSELQRQNQELKAKLENQQRDYDVMSKNYLDHVRMIRATDDDHSTIMERLNLLKATIEHLIRKAQGSRSINLNRTAAIEFLRTSNKLEDFPVPEDKLEPYHLNLFMESVVMSTLVSCFFEKPLCCVFDYNRGFQEIYDWMLVRNPKLAVRWRQQLCVMIMQDPSTKRRQQEEVDTATHVLLEIISSVYANTNEAAKIQEICNRAFDLSMAMTSLESVISPRTVAIGTPFDEETMAQSLKNNADGKVALVIFPPFKDEINGFNVQPKVWCY
ncbi:hypothetical protein BGZ83_009403 [Gryganskiella cystojenkinii]|nr:hypothetical protein BGZ83_009403 [Gryganskiella cystojenkinii]